MMTKKKLFLFLYLFCTQQSIFASSLNEQFTQVGYVEMCNNNHGTTTFDELYRCFDEFIELLQKKPCCAQKLYLAKERFLRSKNKNYYSTDIFGFYDESKKEGRNQISFYYSIHFHDFILLHFPEFKNIPTVTRFFEMCRDIQEPYHSVFDQAASDVNLQSLFYSGYNRPPILLKIIKYLPGYNPTTPHYDGSTFTLFLDSTDNQSLLLSFYKSSFTVDDFSSPIRKFSRLQNQNSMILIPGTLLTDFSIYPTPHIVAHSGSIRYATIAFAMRPNYVQEKNNFSLLPNFKNLE